MDGIKLSKLTADAEVEVREYIEEILDGYEKRYGYISISPKEVKGISLEIIAKFNSLVGEDEVKRPAPFMNYGEYGKPETNKEIVKQMIEEYKVARDEMYGDHLKEESDSALEDFSQYHKLDKE